MTASSYGVRPRGWAEAATNACAQTSRPLPASAGSVAGGSGDFCHRCACRSTREPNARPIVAGVNGKAQHSTIRTISTALYSTLQTVARLQNSRAAPECAGFGGVRGIARRVRLGHNSPSAKPSCYEKYRYLGYFKAPTFDARCCLGQGSLPVHHQLHMSPAMYPKQHFYSSPMPAPSPSSVRVTAQPSPLLLTPAAPLLPARRARAEARAMAKTG